MAMLFEKLPKWTLKFFLPRPKWRGLRAESWALPECCGALFWREQCQKGGEYLTL